MLFVFPLALPPRDGAETILASRATTLVPTDGCDAVSVSSWPSVKLDCGSCRVVVDRFVFAHESCEAYCITVNRTCTLAFELEVDSCDAQEAERACDQVKLGLSAQHTARPTCRRSPPARPPRCTAPRH